MKKQFLKLTLICLTLHVVSYAQQLPRTETLLPGQTKNITDTVMANGTMLKMTNTGVSTLQVFRASAATSLAVSGQGITLTAGQTTTVPIENLGGLPQNGFINAKNLSGLLPGGITILKDLTPWGSTSTSTSNCPQTAWEYKCVTKTDFDFNNNVISSTILDNAIINKPLTARIGIGVDMPETGYIFHLKGNSQNDGNLKVTGNIGIGTNPTSDKLIVQGTTTLKGALNVKANTTIDGGGVVGLSLAGGQQWSTALLKRNLSLGDLGAIEFPTPIKRFGIAGGSDNVLRIFHTYTQEGDNAQIRNLMAFGVNGNIGIQTEPHADYKLSVNGDIRAKRIKVETGWSDFVFAKDYNLMSLQGVENFINENGHLPEIPSASEVQSEGADLGEMVKLQMQKIEELTLYIIQQQKEIEALKIAVK
jgi:hypothetical protein